jgi:vacuolar-type H+-ATPase subunit D/Vma8
VETLERRVGPALEQSIHRVRRVLDEREREDKLRRRHLTRVHGRERG